jgi:hypothetical protein
MSNHAQTQQCPRLWRGHHLCRVPNTAVHGVTHEDTTVP